MSERWRVLGIMTSAQAGSSLVQQALGALSPALVVAFGLSKAQLGAIFTGIMLGAAAFTALSGIVTDRWGERKMLLISAIVMTIALTAASLIPAYWWVVVWLAVYGAGYASATPAGGRAILSWFDRDRGLAMGIRQTGVSVGALAGALCFPVVASWGGYRAALIFAAVLVALTSGAAFLLYRESGEDRGAKQTLPDIARAMGILARDPRLVAVTLTCMLLSGTQFVIAGFLTITAVNDIRTTPHVAGFALAVAFATAIVGRLGWGVVSDRYLQGDRLVPLALNCVLVALGTTMLALAPAGAVASLFIASAILGISAAGWNGLMAAALAEVGGTERAASALGLGLTAIFGASAVAPSLFGALADHTSLPTAWTVDAAIVLLGVAPMLWLRAHLRRPLRRVPSAES
ncbi:MAG TPA: MFS transporter [Candidatus Elarobacter sp.]